MNRIRTIGLCLACAIASSALAVAGPAFAEAPEFGRCLKKATAEGAGFSDAGCTKAVGSAAKYEWIPGPPPNSRFTGVMRSGAATLETVKGTKITCVGEKNSGEIVSAKEVANVVATFTGCTSSTFPCSNAGVEEIVTRPLSGVLGFEKISAESAIKDKLGVSLVGPGHGALAEFACAGVPIVVTGCVIHAVGANKMLLSETEKFTASKGEQKPDHFVPPSGKGETDECTLESSTGGGAPEEAGQTITVTSTAEEKLEASTIN